MNIIMTSVQQNRKKDQVPVNCSQKSYTKLYQVLEAVGSFWPHTSPLIQHKVPAFSLPAIKVETFQDEKKGDDICEQKLSQNPQNFYNVFGGGEKTQCFLFFCGAFFGVVKLLVFLAFRMVPFPCSISSSERWHLRGLVCGRYPSGAAASGCARGPAGHPFRRHDWAVTSWRPLVKSIRNEILPPLMFRGFWISHEFKDPEPWTNQEDSWFMSFTGWKNVVHMSKIWGLGMEIPLVSWCWSTR